MLKRLMRWPKSITNSTCTPMRLETMALQKYTSVLQVQMRQPINRSFITIDDYSRLGEFLEAGRFYHKADLYEQSLLELMKANADQDEHITLAIRVVSVSLSHSCLNACYQAGDARNDKITSKLIDYLMGEVDGVAKDSIHLFSLYLAIGRYQEAAHTACQYNCLVFVRNAEKVLLARDEQRTGSYRAAHDVLLQMCRGGACSLCDTSSS